MNITDTMSEVRNGAKRRISDVKADRLVKEKDELKAENRLLRDELAETRSERRRVLDLLDKATVTPPKKKRRHWLLRLIAVGGAAYAVAAKTGGVERAKEWVDSMRARKMGLEGELMSKGSEYAEQTADTVDLTGRKIEKTGRKVRDAAEKIEQTADNIDQS